jgi:hypothetical protein
MNSFSQSIYSRFPQTQQENYSNDERNHSNELYRNYNDYVTRYFSIASNTRTTINRFTNLLFNQDANIREIINQNYYMLQHNLHNRYSRLQNHNNNIQSPNNNIQSHNNNIQSPNNNIQSHNNNIQSQHIQSQNIQSQNLPSVNNNYVRRSTNNMLYEPMNVVRERQIERQRRLSPLTEHFFQQSTIPQSPTPLNMNIYPYRQSERMNQTMSPVLVIPTEDQINRSTRFIMFESIESPINSSCPITHEEFSNNDMVLQIVCGHIFNNEAIRIWFQSNVRCPICRYDIRDYQYNSYEVSETNQNRNANDNTSNLENNANANDNTSNLENNENSNANDNDNRSILENNENSNANDNDNNYSNTLINSIFNYIRNELPFDDDISSNTIEYTFMTSDINPTRLIPINRQIIRESSVRESTTSLRDSTTSLRDSTTSLRDSTTSVRRADANVVVNDANVESDAETETD